MVDPFEQDELELGTRVARHLRDENTEQNSMEENDDITPEDLVEVLSDESLLAEHDFQVTPKGYMGLTLMKLGVARDAAEQVSQAIDDAIFMGGWIYVRADQVQMVDDDTE